MGTVNEKGQLSLDSPLMIDEQSRVEVIVLVSEDNEAEEDSLTKEEILGDLRSSWQEVQSGNTIPVEQLWSD